MRMRLAVPLLLACSYSTAYAAQSTGRLKQVWFASPLRSLMSPEQLAQSFLNSNQAELGFDPSTLELVRQQESLAAYHFVYQQLANGVPIDAAGLTISISKKDQAVFQYYSSALGSVQTPASKTRITNEQAYDAAWAYVGVSGTLFQAPSSKLQYKQAERGLTLVYSVNLSSTAPYGAWQVDVDAGSGEVIGVSDLRINEKYQPIPSTFGTKQPTSNRQEAFAKWVAHLTRIETPSASKDGNAKLFDPDPKTEMGNTTITDKSPASAFDTAYVQRTLPDVSFSNNVYALKGPWVQIIDFDSPTAAPTTTKDGNWNFVRGQGGFTDAMTYFHIDQTQRYIQSLGFKDETGIQFKSIEADADGANGDDNSYFMPSTNRLAFGHGCVDDNEDADVILHEYGHAINSSINSAWSGGDTGAMGEGFGDYWAGSYSYSTPKGRDFQPDIVYNWDAGSCWPGRSMDATAEKYKSGTTYGAHQSLSSGRQSDELWSTPLFQAHKALIALGIPRGEIDTVILEAQFGLGSSLTMRDMAKSIVATAKRLYPDGPHAEVFKDKFLAQAILVEPTVNLTASLGPVSDTDGVVDPGETVSFPLTISNIGDAAAEGVVATVSSSDASVSSITTPITVGAIADGSKKDVKFGFTLADDASCGGVLNFTLTLKNAAGKTWTVPLKVQIGKPIEAAVSHTVNLAIPDKNTTGISDSIDMSSSANVSATFSVDINIKHTYKGDLKVTLASPSGKEVVLADHTGGSTDNIIGTFPTDISPKEPLSGLIGQKLEGSWTLKVQDTSASDTGTLVSWGIRDVSGYECH